MNRIEVRQQIVAELQTRGIVMTPPGDLILRDIMQHQSPPAPKAAGVP